MDSTTLQLLSEIKEHGDLDKIRELVERGVDFKLFEHDLNALHIAIWKGKLDVVKLILAHGCSIDICTGNGDSPVTVAIVYEQFEILEFLLQANANKNIQNNVGNTPLHIAVGTRDIRSSQLLISSGADINIKNQYGYTALFIASMLGEGRIWEILMNTISPDEQTLLTLEEFQQELPVNMNSTSYKLSEAQPTNTTIQSNSIIYSNSKFEENHIQLLEYLGSGKFGTVWKAIFNSQTVAVKNLQYSKEQQYDLLEELSLMG